MQSITSLATKLQADFPDFIFTPEAEFRWSPQQKTIFYPITSSDTTSLLHETAHAILKHTEYAKDITLIEMERDAWEYAKNELSPRYNTPIDEAIAESALDTYRDWLHARSTCPQCQATGVQIKKDQYKCLACHTQWRTNEARVCALRRYTLT